ncbi:MAG: glycosyltransferase family 4 protein [bacterium]
MLNRPRLLYICFDAVPSPKGASTHVSAFVRTLVEHYDVTLLSLPPFPGFEVNLPVRHIIFPGGAENYLDRALSFQEFIWDHLEEERYDFIHYRSMWAALPVAEEAKRHGTRVVCEVNGVESIELKYHYPALRARPELMAKLRAQEEFAFSSADHIITPSAVTAKYLGKCGVTAEKVTVIPNGVDLELFRPPNVTKANDPLVVLYVGTLTPWQGAEFLLDAFRRAVAVQPLQLQLLSPETNRWRAPLLKRVQRYGVGELVTFLPTATHDTAGEIIATVDICVAPLMPTERNITQGCSPLKLFEYMACARAIVAADLPVTREILCHEETALLYKPNKTSHLVEPLLRLAGDHELRANLGDAARRTVEERFTWARAGEELLCIYREKLPV